MVTISRILEIVTVVEGYLLVLVAIGIVGGIVIAAALCVIFIFTNESENLPDHSEDQTGNPTSVTDPESESSTAQDSQSHEAEQPSAVDKSMEEPSSIYPFIWGMALGCPFFLFVLLPFNYGTMAIALQLLAVLTYFSPPILTNNQRRALSGLTTACLNSLASFYRSIMSLLSRSSQLTCRFVSTVVTSRKKHESDLPSTDNLDNELTAPDAKIDLPTEPNSNLPNIPSREGQSMTQWFYAKGDQKYGPVDFEELKRLAANGKLASSDLIWSPGYEDWIPAWKASGLFSSNPIPPPLKIAAGMTSNANVSSEGASSSSNEMQKLIEKRLMTITRLLLPIVMSSVTGLIAVAFGKDLGQVAAVISLAVIVIQVLVVYCSGIVLW